jgi:N,N'-diacetyllegionaminate synthase
MLIAEIGSVHDGSFGNAQKLIELASACGADAVKFQTHIAEAESLLDAPSPEYFKDEPRVDYFKRTAFSVDQWFKLKQLAESCGLVFLSSPFSIEAADFLEALDMAVYKIPSGEITNIPLLEKVASFKKPVLLSSGMSDWRELDTAVSVFRDHCDLTVMQCSSVYPCPPESIGLNVLHEIQQRYACAVGFSDHSLGLAAPIAAAALGASVIEKHFTFSKFMYGSDAKHSMEPYEFKLLAFALKDVWRMLKSPVNKNDSSNYRNMKEVFQKSIVSAVPLKAGTYIKKEHLSFKKPGTGIPASEYSELIGKKIKLDCGVNVLMKKEWFE